MCACANSRTMRSAIGPRASICWIEDGPLTASEPPTSSTAPLLAATRAPRMVHRRQMRCCLPSLRPAAFPPPSPPPISVGFVRCFNGTTQPSDSSSVPRQLRLLDFLSRPGIAKATAGQTRSPRFRRDPFVRDVASDPGRATVPRITAPHMLPSAVATASAPATSRISWLNPTPQTITVYASPWSSPSTTQHSLPGGRYPFPGPDFHRLDRASWLCHTNGSRKGCSQG